MTETLQQKIDAISNHGIYKGSYLIERYLVDKALQEFREQIEALNHIYCYPKYSEAIKDVLALLGEQK